MAGTLRVSPSADVVLGRDAGGVSVHLPHPSVSRSHARVYVEGTGLALADLGSTNGTFVDGRRVSRPTAIGNGARVTIGPYSWVVQDLELVAESSARAPQMDAVGVIHDVDTPDGPRRLLSGVSLSLRPGTMAAVLGPSGCGKSTLLRILSGRDRATAGGVRYDGLDLVEHFSTLKHAIAFVPQRETLPEDLEVAAALEFTARLRLPADSAREDVDTAVSRALARVGLEDRANVRIAQLSGGQRKRVALANELIAEPGLLFLDEVTSGLDDATDRAIMQLLQELAAEGMSVVCVTHTVSNVAETCDELVVLAPGGHLAFHGPPDAAPRHFGCSSLPQIYEALEARAGASWAVETRGSSVPDAPAAHRADRASGGPSDRRNPLSQLPVLLQRNVAVALGDAKGVGMALVQALAVGVLFRLAYGAGAPSPAEALQFAFLLGVSALWFGCSNGSKELVKERELFRLERNINLRIGSYVASKLALLAMLGAAQVVLMHGVLAASGVRMPHVRVLLVLHLCVVVIGSSLGLLISAYAERPSQAATVVPLALIPQIVLSAAVVPDLPTTAEWVSRLSVSAYWMYRIQMDVFGVGTASVTWAYTALAAHLVVAIAATGLLLNRAGGSR